LKLNFGALLCLSTSLGFIFFYAPEEAQQGIVQKIFYIHVSSALTMYIGFFLSFLASLMFLLEHKTFWDEISVCAAEVAFFLCTVVLLTGPIWAKPIWGAWWTWDPRLTTTFLLWMMYAAYLVLRSYLEGSSRQRTVSAILAIIAFLDVPLIHFSVRLWRGIHPSVIGSKQGGLPPSMQLTLTLTLIAFVMFFFALFMTRLRLEQTRNQVAALYLKREGKS